MSFETKTKTGFTCCTLCSLGCGAGLRTNGPDRYVPDYPEGSGGGYAGLCARGSMLAELTNHRDRLLWPLAGGGGGWRELSMADAVRRASETLRVESVNAQPRVVIDGNFDLGSLAQAAAAFERLLPKGRIGIYLPQADAELLGGCEASGAEYLAPQRLSDSDAVLVVGNPFGTHPVIAHWLLHPRNAKPRRPLMVLDARAGVTYSYATSACVVRAGLEHVALAVVAGALGVKGRECNASEVDAGLLEGWARALSTAKSPAVIVASEFGRAARWAEIGRLSGEIARAAGGSLLPLTIYGNALGAVRLAEKLGLGGGASQRPAAGESGVTVALGTGMAERIAGAGRCISGSSLRPAGAPGVDLALPLAWPFEVSGPVLLPGRGLEMSESAIRPPAGVPTAGQLAAAIAGGPGHAVTDFAGLPRARGAAAKAPDLSPLDVSGSGDGLVTVLVGDCVNFADGAVSRRASFARSIFPSPALALSRSDASRLGVSDGEVVRVGGASSGAGTEILARVEVEAGQAAGRAVLSGAYPEAVRLMADASGGGGLGPVRLSVRAARE